MVPLPLNLLATERAVTPGEHIDPLLEGAGFRLERICSFGVASPEGFWYDQEQPEWVMLVRGEAVLEFGSGEKLSLRTGDTLTIPSGCKHRVVSVVADAIWLALHFTPTK